MEGEGEAWVKGDYFSMVEEVEAEDEESGMSLLGGDRPR